MKILHIYAGNLFGGVETLLVTLARERSLCPQMQPQFALCFEGRLADELRSCGADVHILGEVRVRHPWTVWRARQQLNQLLKQEQFDAAICHACWPQAIFGSVVKSQHLPLIFWCHDTPNGKHWIEQWAKRTLPDLAIANSLYTQTALPRLYPQIRSEILLCPVPAPDIGNSSLDSFVSRTSIRSTVRAELNTPNDAVVIIQASRLVRLKGQTVLLSALGQLGDLSGWTCWIVGGVQGSSDAEYLQELKVQAHSQSIGDRVHFLGQRSDVPRLLAAADIHCQPNTSPETFGIVFVEALYAGLPVVTTAIGGALEIVHKSCGRLVAPNDTDALSDILRLLITNPNQRAKLAIHGPARAKQLCDPTRQLIQLHKLISQLVRQEIVA